MGDIGQNTARSCSEYLKAHHIKVINRTNSVAVDLAEQIKVEAVLHDTLKTEIQQSDIVIVATGASNPTVSVNDVSSKKQLFIDLSVPKNVDSSIHNLENKEIIDVDMLSKKTEKTLEDRMKQIPMVEEIIQKYKAEFYEWLNFRRSTPAINSFKKSLEIIQQDAISSHLKKNTDMNSDHVEDVTSQMINKIVSKFAMHLKSENTMTNQSIKVMKDVFNLETTEI